MAFIFLFQNNASAEHCVRHKKSETFAATKNKVEVLIQKFANQKSSAEKADATLSKLVNAKSKLIANWLENRGVETRSEDDIIRDWREYYARNFVLIKYPHDDAVLNADIEKLVESVNGLFNDKAFQTKMQRLFAQSKERSLTLIGTLPINDEAKKQITQRIEGIALYWMKDFKTSKFKQLPLDFIDWGIAYDPTANEINMGFNALAYPNDETYLAVFAHEIGHAFDSCRWGAFFKGEWPFERIGACLRSPESVGAKKRDDSQLSLLEKTNKDLVLALKQHPTCNKLVYPPEGVQADQLPEAFGDWFSAEVMASIKDLKTAGLRTDLCEKKELKVGSSYPTNDLRLHAIYLTHPRLSKNEPGLHAYQYCSLGVTK